MGAWVSAGERLWLGWIAVGASVLFLRLGTRFAGFLLVPPSGAAFMSFMLRLVIWSCCGVRRVFGYFIVEDRVAEFLHADAFREKLLDPLVDDGESWR